MGGRENECQISQNCKITYVFTILVKFDLHFLGLLREIFFGPQKMQKRMQYSLNYSGARFLATEN